MSAYPPHSLPVMGASLPTSAVPAMGIPYPFRMLGSPGSTGPEDAPQTRRQPPKKVPATTRTISVERIPRASLSPQDIESYFKDFGRLLDVTVDSHQSRALVTFSNVEEANRALSSPAAVFGNRFVRIYRVPEPVNVPSTSQGEVYSGVDNTADAVIGRKSEVKPRDTTDSERRADEEAAARRARADAMQSIADQQKAALHKLEQLEGDVSERQSIMENLRKLAREAEHLRGDVPASSTPELEAVAQLKRLREEVSDDILTRRRANAQFGQLHRQRL